jgi:AraC-like DNA-binding protein
VLFRSDEVIQALAFSAPALCALACLIVMVFDAFYSGKSRQERQLRFYLSLTYLVAGLCWMGLVLDAVNHRAFVHYHTLFLFTLMMGQVLIYRFVHIITATEEGRPFSRLHFVVPFLLTVVALVSTFVVSFEERMAVIYHTGESAGNAWFSLLYSLTRIVFIVYNMLYPVLGLLRIRLYRLSIVDYSADTQRTSLGWLSVMFMLTLITIPVPLTGMLLGLDVFDNFWTSMQGVAPTFFIYPILCYNLLSDNYVIILPNDDVLPEKAANIDPKRFAKYLRDKKPYLNPKLKITDLCRELGTNRSYLSGFINEEYGMNFSRLINHYRLAELDQLRSSSPQKERSNIDLVLLAGFSSYQSYLRVKNEEYRESILKVF